MKKEILVIDGSRAIRFLLQTIFRKHYKVISVPDGMSAMHYLRLGNKPQLVVISPELDDMNDWELVKHFSLSPLYNHIPLVVLSSKDEAELKANVIKYNVVEYFSKPFNPLKLIETVDAVLLGNRLVKI